MDFQTYLHSQDLSSFEKSYLFKNIDRELYNKIFEQVNKSSPIDCYKVNPDAFVEVLLSIYSNMIINKMSDSDYHTFVDYLIKSKNVYSIIDSLHSFGDDTLNNKLLEKLSTLLTSKILKITYADPVYTFTMSFLKTYIDNGYDIPVTQILNNNDLSQELLHNTFVNIISKNDFFSFKEPLTLIISKLNSEYLLKSYIIFIDSIHVSNLNIHKNNIFYSEIMYQISLKLELTMFKETFSKMIGIMLFNNELDFYTIPFIQNELNKQDSNLKKSYSYNNNDYIIFLTGLLNNKNASLILLKDIFPFVPTLFQRYLPFFDIKVFSTIFPLLKETDLFDLVYKINKKLITIEYSIIYIQSIYQLSGDNKNYYFDFFSNNIKRLDVLEIINLDYELQNF